MTTRGRAGSTGCRSPASRVGRDPGRHRITVCVEDAIADVGIGAHLSHHIGRTHPR
ncbi:hypothetical protein GR255_06645, partial [Mycobacterium tuberculosis]|nr:hypothetical protein [Mycobacterium tuberculosis]